MVINVDASGMAALLDMMRYDGSTVVAWDKGVHSDLLLPGALKGDNWYTITLRGRPTPDRWRSFGVAVFEAYSPKVLRDI